MGERDDGPDARKTVEMRASEVEAPRRLEVGGGNAPVDTDTDERERPMGKNTTRATIAEMEAREAEADSEARQLEAQARIAEAQATTATVNADARKHEVTQKTKAFQSVWAAIKGNWKWITVIIVGVVAAVALVIVVLYTGELPTYIGPDGVRWADDNASSETTPNEDGTSNTSNGSAPSNGSVPDTP